VSCKNWSAYRQAGLPKHLHKYVPFFSQCDKQAMLCFLILKWAFFSKKKSEMGKLMNLLIV